MSIQFTPCSTACWMAEIESASSCLPQLKAQPAPPMAQAPKPTRVMRMPVVPKSAIDSEVLRALVNVIRLVSRPRAETRTCAKKSQLRICSSDALRLPGFLLIGFAWDRNP